MHELTAEDWERWLISPLLSTRRPGITTVMAERVSLYCDTNSMLFVVSSWKFNAFASRKESRSVLNDNDIVCPPYKVVRGDGSER